MASLLVQIERVVDDDFPGFVECVLIDAAGCQHAFIDKLPVVSTEDLRCDSVYPQQGNIDCAIEREWIDEHGRRLVSVDTNVPWSIESVTGETLFTVLDEQVARD